MDPYLEQAIFWSEFHSRLIVAIADALAPSLLPKYYIAVETRTDWDSTGDDLLVGIPDSPYPYIPATTEGARGGG